MRTGAVEKLRDGRRLVKTATLLRAVAPERVPLVAPRENARIGAARRKLPLGLRRQLVFTTLALREPEAERHGFIPVGKHHRMIVTIPRRPKLPVVGIELFVLGIGHGRHGHIISPRQLDRVRRFFVVGGFGIGTAHRKLGGFNPRQRHADGVGPRRARHRLRRHDRRAAGLDRAAETFRFGRHRRVLIFAGVRGMHRLACPVQAHANGTHRFQQPVQPQQHQQQHHGLNRQRNNQRGQQPVII